MWRARDTVPIDPLVNTMQESDSRHFFRWTLWLLLAVLALEVAATVLLFNGVPLSSTAIFSILFCVIACSVSSVAILARNRFRVRLSTFLLLSAIVACGIGVIAAHTAKMRRQFAAAQVLSQYGCEITYDQPPMRALLESIHLDS